MNILFGIALLLQPLIGTSLYNDARVIYHAVEPNTRSELEGIDPGKTIDVIEKILGEFVEYTVDLSEAMKSRIQTLRKSLLAAKIQYFSCISLVKRGDELEKAKDIACNLSLEVEKLFLDPSQPPLLFIGGYYAYSESGSLGGHTVTYEVFRQENGLLSFAVNNTAPNKIHHQVDGDRICQLVYTDLQPTDLDACFWENVIRINYMNPTKEKLMDSFYNYLNAKLLKDPTNKTTGQWYEKQKVGVCAWKSIWVWLHGHMDERSPDFEKFMLETLLTHFHPDESSSIFLKAELKRKIEEL